MLRAKVGDDDGGERESVNLMEQKVPLCYSSCLDLTEQNSCLTLKSA